MCTALNGPFTYSPACNGLTDTHPTFSMPTVDCMPTADQETHRRGRYFLTESHRLSFSERSNNFRSNVQKMDYTHKLANEVMSAPRALYHCLMRPYVHAESILYISWIVAIYSNTPCPSLASMEIHKHHSFSVMTVYAERAINTSSESFAGKRKRLFKVDNLDEVKCFSFR